MSPPGAWLAQRLGVSYHTGLGLVFVVCVTSIWVASSFVVQDIQAAGAKPVVLTYIANSLFALYLPIFWVKEWWLRRKRAGREAVDEERGHLVSEWGLSDGPPADLHAQAPQGEPDEAAKQLSTRQVLSASLVVAPLWYLAQLTFNASLLTTSVTTNTLLSSTSVLFTFLFSAALLSERFTLRTLGCILLLMAGTAAVTVAGSLASPDASAARHTLFGSALCLLSAALYGAYTVAIRRMLGEDETTSVLLFFGYMGVIIFVGVGIVLALAAGLGATLGPLPWPVFWAIIAKGLLDNVLSDYLWARAVLLLGPTLASAGMSLQVPLAVAADAIFRSPAWMHSGLPLVLTALGGSTILAGFLAMTLAPAGAPVRGDARGGAATPVPAAELALETSPRAPRHASID